MILLAGCAGLMQRPLPRDVATWRAVGSGSGLRAGAAHRDITPEGVQYLGGFDLGRTSAGVAHPLEVRALVLALGEMEVALVGIDNLGLMRGDADWVKTAVAGIPGGNVFLCSSHTHAAPDLVGLWGWWLLTSGRDRAYLARLRQAVGAAVAEARAGLRPARLRHGRVELPEEGLVRNSNREGVFDRRFVVLQAVDRETEEPLATLFHLACHPEVLPRRNRLVSSDFAGELCRRWRESGYGEAVFVNGALGAMVTPDVEERTPEGVAAMADELLRRAEAAVLEAGDLEVDALEVRRRDVYMPLDSFGLEMARATGVIPRQLHEGHIRTTVGYLRIGALEAVAVPGEMEPLLAEEMRSRLERPGLLVLGLCDDEVGYLLREEDARDPLFAYERTMSPCLTAGERIVDALCGGERTDP